MALLGKKSVRLAKNYTLGYSETQAKVRNATSSDQWPPSAKELDEITQLSFRPEAFTEIAEILSKRLGDKGKSWRHVHKSLVLTEHLLCQGSDATATYFKENIHTVKSLREFQYVDEKAQDHGALIRSKAKEVTNLLEDSSVLDAKRRTRAIMRSDTLTNILNRAYESEEQRQNENEGRRDHSVDVGSAPNLGIETDAARIAREVRGDTNDLLRAIEESKCTTLEGTSGMTSEERDIFRAMELSLQESAQVPRSHLALGVGDDRYSTPGASTSGSASRDPDLLIDLSEPEYETSPQPQLQYTPFASPLSAVAPLQTSSPPVQVQYNSQQQTYLGSAFVAPPHVQLSPMQPQTYSLPAISPYLGSPPGEFPAYGTNNPFTATPMTSPRPSFSSLSSSFNPSYASVPQQPGQYVSPILDQVNLSSSPLPKLMQASTPSYTDSGSVHTTISPTSVSLHTSSHLALEAVFATHTQGIDTFGNIGQLRYGAATNNTYKSNNPFANLR